MSGSSTGSDSIEWMRSVGMTAMVLDRSARCARRSTKVFNGKHAAACIHVNERNMYVGTSVV